VRWILDTSPIPQRPAPELDAQQRAVVSHRGGALLVLAGPGTGKTTTLVETVVNGLVEDRFAANQILALTFGRRAAGELRDRIAARIGGGSLPIVATFHSFAYGFVQRGLGADIAVPQLLSGAEEDVRVRDLLLGAVHDGTIQWPEDLTAALPTLGMANEVRAVLARARTLGIAPDELREIGRRADRPAWEAVGQLAVQEQAVMALQDVMDYTELLNRALALAEQEPPDYRLIVVDEYQDTDPLQVAFLQALVGIHTTLIAVGDPDQAIYGFRGADVRAISRFATDFPGAVAPIVLRSGRRFGPHIRQAALTLLGGRSLPGIPAAVHQAHRDIEAVGSGDDRIEITRYESSSSLAAHIAEDIAEAHVHRGVPWHELAVLTRASRDMIAVQQALLRAHIPVVMSTDDMPLRLEPAVTVLLDALRLAVRPEAVHADQLSALFTGPLCGLTIDQVRQWGRALRRAARESASFPPPAKDLMRDAFLHPTGDPRDETERRIHALHELLMTAHQQVRASATPAEVLWTLWSGRIAGQRAHGWPERLHSAAIRGSRTANHDLDAVLGLFDAADRFVGRRHGAAGVLDFLGSLAAQELPAEPVAERGLRADAVRVLTTHRAKGLEWDEVWVVGLQEGRWPDLRPRGSILEAQQLHVDGIGSTPDIGEIMAEERRLAYVALTRARSRLHIAVVDEPTEVRPSRFIDELREAGCPDAAHIEHPQPTSLNSLVAECRAALDDPVDGPAAAALLASLAQARDDDGEPLVPLADPNQWWWFHERTESDHPVVPADAPVPLSGSAVDLVNTCPRRWFLERKANAQQGERSAAATGTIVHGLAEYVARGEIPADIDELDALVDEVWGALNFQAPWQAQAERGRARAAISAFLAYQAAATRSLEGIERELSATLDVPTPNGEIVPVLITGKIDRIERDADGLVFPVDLKTSKTRVTGPAAEEHPQLGVYQLLVRASGESVGGAALLQLGLDVARPVETPQAALPDQQPTWIELDLGKAAEVIRAEQFWARPNDGCRHCSFATSCPAQLEGGAIA
jgi:superfamily I DNA/RNA helicase/RecB family exonuclease